MDPIIIPDPPSPQLPTEIYWKKLVAVGYDARDHPFVARFGRLSQLNITYLLNELITIKADIRQSATTSQEQMERLGLVLHQYSEWEAANLGHMMLLNRPSPLAEAIRDYKFMCQLHPLPDTFAFYQRRELEMAFEPLITPQGPSGHSASAGPERSTNVPYDNQYMTLNPKPTQHQDPIREFLRHYLPRHLSWTEEEKSVRRADFSHGLPPEMISTAASPALHSSLDLMMNDSLSSHRL